MIISAAHPRPLALNAIITLAFIVLAACGGGGGGGTDSESAGAILETTQPAPPPATPAEVTAAAIHYRGHREGARVTVGRGGRPLTFLTTPAIGRDEVHTSSLLDPLTNLLDGVIDAIDVFNLFDDGDDDDGGTSIAEFFPAGPDDEWTYVGDAEVLQGADPGLVFVGVSDDDRATWGYTLVAQKDGLYFSEQEVDGGVITAEPKLLWIPSDLHDRPPLEGRRYSEATLTYTPSQGDPQTAHIKRTIVLLGRAPHATLHSYSDDVLVFAITDNITRSDGPSAWLRYDLYLARDLGPVECAVRQEILGEIIRHTEIERATIGGRDLPDTDGDGIVDAVDLDDDGDEIPDDHLGSATPGDHRCTIDTVGCDDALPKDPSEQADFDGDGLGNRSDPDADGDGVGDDGDDDGVRHDHPCTATAVACDDAFPLDPGEWADADGDGTGNIADLDDDNDGVADVVDACPYTHDPCPDSGAPQAGVATRIATTGDPSPDGLRHFASLGSPGLNDDGTVLFPASLTIDPGTEPVPALLLADGGGLTIAALQGQSLPGDHDTLVELGRYALNDRGQVAFSAYGTDASQDGPQDYGAIFRRDGALLTEMGYRGGYVDRDEISAVPGLPSVSLNNHGEVAFWNGTLYRSDGATRTPIAFDGQADPAGDGTLDLQSTGPGRLNDAGEIAFESYRVGGSVPAPLGIFRGDGETLTAIVTQGDPVQADGSEILSRREGPLHLNEAGQVAFRALVGTVPAQLLGGRLTIVRGDGDGVTTIPGGTYEGIALNDAGQVASITQIKSTRQEAILVADETSAQEIVRQGEVPPGGEGTFGTFQFGRELTWDWGCLSCPPSASRPLPGATPSFAHLALTDGGTVMFRAALAGTSAGMDDDQGVYLGDPQEVIQVVRHGDPLAGSTVEYILVFAPRLSRYGQVAYQVQLADGREGIFRFTPHLYWRAGGNGGWDDHSNWTVGLSPGRPHPVSITPPHGLTVTGPVAPVVIESLAIGAQASGTATLVLRAGGDLTVTHGVTVQQAGALTGDGTLVADVVNAGRVQPALTGGPMTVDGDYVQTSAGRLGIAIGPAGNGLLAVDGTATVGGTLEITVADGFQPSPGDTFTIVTAGGGVIGGFPTVSGLDPGTGILFEVQYTPNAVNLLATKP